MTDKPKRKHSLNRRRKFLLMIVLPTVALIVGFMALSPQINAWLATDPFTRQCHFETDRLFATGHPLTFGSMNDGLYSEIETYEIGSDSYYWEIDFHLSWSPDGQTIYYYMAEENPVEHTVYFEFDTFLWSVKENQPLTYLNDFTSGGWSPDGRYFYIKQSDGKAHPVNIELSLFDTQTEGYRVNIIVNETRDRDNNFNVVDWSDDSTKILIQQNVYKLYDVETRELVVLDHIATDLTVTWSDDLNHFYYMRNSTVYVYSVDTQQETKLFDLPYIWDTTTVMPLFDENVILVTKQYNNNFDQGLLYYRDTDELYVLEYGTFTIRAMPDGQHVLGFVYDSENGEQLMKFNVDTRHYDLLSLRGDPHLYSQSHRWLLYYQYGDSDSPSDYYLYNLDSQHNTYITPTDHINRNLSWLEHDGKEYIVFHEFVREQEFYRLYLIDPETLNRCKVAIVGESFAFQPQG